MWRGVLGAVLTEKHGSAKTGNNNSWNDVSLQVHGARRCCARCKVSKWGLRGMHFQGSAVSLCHALARWLRSRGSLLKLHPCNFCGMVDPHHEGPECPKLLLYGTQNGWQRRRNNYRLQPRHANKQTGSLLAASGTNFLHC